MIFTWKWCDLHRKTKAGPAFYDVGVKRMNRWLSFLTFGFPLSKCPNATSTGGLCNTAKYNFGSSFSHSIDHRKGEEFRKTKQSRWWPCLQVLFCFWYVRPDQGFSLVLREIILSPFEQSAISLKHKNSTANRKDFYLVKKVH